MEVKHGGSEERLRDGFSAQSSKLHIIFFPFFAHGHLLPLVDVARVFALRGVKCTVVTTPGNVGYIKPNIDLTNAFLGRKDNPHLMPISISTIPFPSAEVGLPEGVENVSVSSKLQEIRQRFFQAIMLLEKPFEQKLMEMNLDAFISDSFFTWSADVSARTGIPRLAFTGTGLLARSAFEKLYQMFASFPDEVNSFIIPDLPDQLQMHRSQFSFFLEEKGILDMVKGNSEKDARSYSEISNSFLELETEYAPYWREVIGRKAWMIGPVVLCNEELMDKYNRGGGSTSTGTEILQWLDCKRRHSVVYICFGSIANLNVSLEQLKKIATALEESDHDFIWVIKSLNKEGFDDWLEGFERRMDKQKKGLIIRGWAPQLLILNHLAVGGFMTHCGWNSTVEAISAGVPMITWPMNDDQFFNEKLVVEIHRVGAAIGATEGHPYLEKRQIIETETIKSAIKIVVGEGVKAEAMRKRAEELKEKAKAAVQVGGSSYTDLGNLIEELTVRRNKLSD